MNPANPLLLGNSSALRVAADVLHHLAQVFLIANDAIVALLLPQCPLPHEQAVDPARRVALADLKDRFHGMAGKRSNDKVTVIWHDREAGNEVSSVLKKQDCLEQDLGKSRLREVGGTMSFVQPPLGLHRDLSRVRFPVLI
jgi:hypothetical protein